MKSVSEALDEFAILFKNQRFFNPKRQAEELISDLIDCSLADLKQIKKNLTNKEWKTAQLWMERRLKGEPLAYISGKMTFYDCLLKVNSSVLIPRQETEILVDKIVNTLKSENLKNKILWDLCSGSGCIGIALKKKFPTLEVILSDESPQALEVAAANAAANQVKISLVKGDLLTPFFGQKAHYVVCNPPYLSEIEYDNLDPSVKNFEPRGALVGGKRGIEMYETLAQELPFYLHPQAKVWFEIGYQQKNSVLSLFSKLPWKNLKIEKDWGGQDRFFFLETE